MGQRQSRIGRRQFSLLIVLCCPLLTGLTLRTGVTDPPQSVGRPGAVPPSVRLAVGGPSVTVPAQSLPARVTDGFPEDAVRQEIGRWQVTNTPPRHGVPVFSLDTGDVPAPGKSTTGAAGLYRVTNTGRTIRAGSPPSLFPVLSVKALPGSGKWTRNKLYLYDASAGSVVGLFDVVAPVTVTHLHGRE